MILLFLQKYWRDILIILLVVVLAFSFQKCNQKDRDIELITNTAGGFFDSLIESHINFNRLKTELITTVNTHAIETRQLKAHNKELGIDKKRLTKQVGRLENVVAILQVKALARDTFTVTNTDTTYIERGLPIQAKYFDWHNEHIQVQGIHTGTSTIIDYKYKIGFELIPYWKRNGFLGLGKSQLVTDIRFDDPNVRVKEMKAVVITPPKNRETAKKGFWAGVGAAAMYILIKSLAR